MEPARCPDCNAALEHPGAACFWCDYDPTPAPANDRALDAWERKLEQEAAGSLAGAAATLVCVGLAIVFAAYTYGMDRNGGLTRRIRYTIALHRLPRRGLPIPPPEPSLPDIPFTVIELLTLGAGVGATILILLFLAVDPSLVDAWIRHHRPF